MYRAYGTQVTHSYRRRIKIRRYKMSTEPTALHPETKGKW